MFTAQMFQFHKGTIKTYSSSEYGRIFPLFQFHKGTIKTSYYGYVYLVIVKFQFHKGTIKTVREDSGSKFAYDVSIP